MKAVRYLDQAREEFLHEVEYFTAASPRLGRRSDREVQRAETLAAHFAGIGAPCKYGTRRLFPGKFMFSIVHLARSDEIDRYRGSAVQAKTGLLETTGRFCLAAVRCFRVFSAARIQAKGCRRLRGRQPGPLSHLARLLRRPGTDRTLHAA